MLDNPKPLGSIDLVSRHQSFMVPGRKPPACLSLLAVSNKGPQIFAVTSASIATMIDKLPADERGPFGERVWPQESDGRSAADLAGVLEIRRDMPIVRQDLDDAAIVRRSALGGEFVFYDDADVSNIASVTAVDAKVAMPGYAYEHAGLVTAQRTASTSFGQPGLGPRLVRLFRSPSTLAGILAAGNGSSGVILALEDVFAAYHIRILRDSEIDQNNANLLDEGEVDDLALRTTEIVRRAKAAREKARAGRAPSGASAANFDIATMADFFETAE